ncbi:MAG: diguanylate cyclase [Deltaproteobacteria bacterium]|nr:diguanylate cyclase [Deltaproteobacteria bacterium]
MEKLSDQSNSYEMDDKSFEVDYQKATGASFTDGLTGLFNHGFFQIYLDREIKRYERYGTGFAVALIDVDWFFFYNHRYGVLQGDRALKQIAGVILENIRKTDLAARYAGDVFSVIFSESCIEGAIKPLERIRSMVEQMQGPPITVSVGIAGYPQDATSRERILERAHAALNEAKVRGKNGIYFYRKEKSSTDEDRPVVLIVDDEPTNTRFLEALLKPENVNVVKANNGDEALHLLTKMDVDVVLLDVMMPCMDGFEACRRIKGNAAHRMIPVIFVTSLDDIDSRVKGIEAGGDDFITKPVNGIELVARTKSLINVKRLNSNLASIENVLFSLAITVEAKDAYTQGHIERVANVAMLLGRKMGLSQKEIEALRFGGTLHDIGKIGVPEEILNKPGPLTEKEFEIMKSHADIGYRICSPLKKNLGPALDVIRHHHEKLDGSGYPDGLKGDEISMVARIMAVADMYDALITDRPYRKAMSRDNAFEVLNQEAQEGKIDQQVVKCLIDFEPKNPAQTLKLVEVNWASL